MIAVARRLLKYLVWLSQDCCDEKKIARILLRCYIWRDKLIVYR